MEKIFLYSVIALILFNTVLLTFLKEYTKMQGKTDFEISIIQHKVFSNEANFFEIIIIFIINIFSSLKNIMIYILAGAITLIAYLISLLLKYI